MYGTGRSAICKNCGKEIVELYCVTDRDTEWGHQNISVMFNRNACHHAEPKEGTIKKVA